LDIEKNCLLRRTEKQSACRDFALDSCLHLSGLNPGKDEKRNWHRTVRIALDGRHQFALFESG